MKGHHKKRIEGPKASHSDKKGSSSRKGGGACLSKKEKKLQPEDEKDSPRKGFINREKPSPQKEESRLRHPRGTKETTSHTNPSSMPLKGRKKKRGAFSIGKKSPLTISSRKKNVKWGEGSEKLLLVGKNPLWEIEKKVVQW